MIIVVLKSVFFFVVALTIAAMEVEAEGKNGWAEKMPTWYRKNGLAAKIYGLFMSGKPLTGYHCFIFLLPLLFFHAPFFLGLSWEIKSELKILSIYFLFAPVWDLLWFIINPYYGINKFSKENVWWHNKSIWIAGLPLDYYGGILISLVLAYFAGSISSQIITLLVFIILTVITVILSPWYHKWYIKMRRRDERNEFEIFHKEEEK